MIKSVSHASVSRLVTDRSMCFATALDKALENIDCMIAILRSQAKNRPYESSQRLIQQRRVRCGSLLRADRSPAKINVKGMTSSWGDAQNEGRRSAGADHGYFRSLGGWKPRRLFSLSSSNLKGDD
jgi:hypothetical protein